MPKKPKPNPKSASVGETKHTVSVDVLAKLFSIGATRIQQLADDKVRLKNGGLVIHRVAHGQYNLWESIIGFVQHQRERFEGMKSTDAEAALADETSPRRRRETADAELAEIALAEKRGELISTVLIAAAWNDMAVHARTKIQNLPAKLSPVLADRALPENQIKTIIEKSTHEALDEIADYDPTPFLDRHLPDPDAVLPSARADHRQPMG